MFYLYRLTNGCCCATLIALSANIDFELRTMIKGLNGIGMWKLWLVAGCLLLVFNSSFGQVNGDFRTIGNVTLASSTNWERYNGSAWVAAGAAPVLGDNVITIRTGHTATVTADKTLDQVVVASGGVLTINAGRDFTLSNGPGTDLTVSGTVNNSGILSQPGTIVFNASSTYNHARDGGSIPNILWNAASNCNITGVTANVPGGLGQSFGNFTWNCSGQTVSELNINQLAVDNGGVINGDFNVVSTGTGSVRLANITPRVLAVSGDFNISGGTFILAIETGTGTVNIGGDFNMTGGTARETGSSSGKFVFANGGTTQNFRRTAGTITNNIGFTVNSTVTIDFGTTDYANGGGTFTLRNGATLQTANPLGVNGSVQTTSRSLSTSANYTFYGTAAQVTGTYLPATVNNFTINNTNGITLTNTVNAAGTLYMNSGNISTAANTFILSNPLSTALNYTAGIIVGRFERFINTTSVNYLFPVGSTVQIQTLTASFVSLTAGSLLVQFIPGNPGNSGLPLTDGDGSKVTDQFTTGYWSALAKNSLASINYKIDLNAAGFGPYAINAGTRLMKRTDTGGSWFINGTHSDAVGSVVKRAGLSGISNAGGGTQFGIGKSGPGILTHPSNKTVCENAGTSFSVTANGYPTLSFQWYKAPDTPLVEGGRFTGTNLATINISNIILSDGGDYYCIVTDEPGNTVQSNTASLSVNALPVPTFTIQPGATACSATNVIYTTQTGQTGYIWTFTGVSGTDYSITSGGTATDNTVTLKWLTAGSKTVTISYTNAGGCTAATATSSTATLVTLLPIPTFTIQPGATACSATNVIYTTQSGQTGYIWTFTGVSGTDYSITSGGTATDNTVTLKWLTAGSKTVTISYTNAGGCTAATATSSTATLVTLLPTPNISGPTPVCVGAAGNVYTTDTGMSNYTWSVSAGGTITGGGGIANNTVTVTWTTSGAQTVTVNYINSNGCTAISPIIYNVTINPLPVATASNTGPVCIGNALSLTGGPAAMTTYAWTGPNGFTSSIQNPLVSDNTTFAIAGVYILKATSAGGCTSTATTIVTVNENPITIAGPDQELTFVFETQMASELSSPETGEWSLISGSGHISDIHSPTTMITELSTGENIFLWKVQNGSCETSEEVKITVYDLFVPSVITPDGDGKNDYFKISEKIGKVELIIFNRWGDEEYRNSNYLNDWDGRNNKSAELPYDTYFYILKLENGKMKRGSILILR